MKLPYSRRAAIGALWLLGIAALWEVLPSALRLPVYIFPRLSVVLNQYRTDTAYLVENGLITLLEAAVGLAIGATIGIALGIAAARSDTIADATRRFAVVLQTVPIVAIAPLIVIWAGPGLASKVVMASIIAMPPVLVAAVEGFRAAPADLIASLRIMGANEGVVSRKVRFPFALSHLSVGLRVAAALSVIGAIVAEYAGSTGGIGYVIMQASYRLDTPTMFAAVIAAIACGLALVYIVHGFSVAALKLATGRS